jgi:ribosome-associated translation inhibitor RaiA
MARQFVVSIDLTLPGHELAVRHESADHEDLDTAINCAFSQMTRRLKEERGRRGRRREARRTISTKPDAAA